MKEAVFYTAGTSDALQHAKNRLQQWGYAFSAIPSEHVTHLMLPVPSFEATDVLTGGQQLSQVLRHLSENITIFGGNLPPMPYRRIDLLQDEPYLCENAAITARCACEILRQKGELQGASVLVIGCGRIGKALLPLLKAQGAFVTTAVRKERDLFRLRERGESAVHIPLWDTRRYDIIVNTAPAPLLDEKQTHPDALLVDLASVRGIKGERVLWARGLPSKMAPEESGTLIAQSVVRFLSGKEQV